MATPIEFIQLAGRLTMMWKPEPTGEFQSEETLKTMLQMEKILREQIAEDIRKYMANYVGDFTDAIAPVLVSIARGENG